MRVELLYFEGCPSYEALLPRLEVLLDGEGIPDRVDLRAIESAEDAERERFLGSPTIRIDGEDIEPGSAMRSDFGLKCRLYPGEAGTSGLPPERWIVEALRRRAGHGP